VRVAVYTEQSLRSLPEVLDFPCGAGARTPDELRAVEEVEHTLRTAQRGRLAPTRLIVIHDVHDAPVGLAVVLLEGDRKLTREPYIETIARHDAFRGRVLADGVTSPGGAALRASLDVLALLHDGRLPSVTARVLAGNASSHRLFAGQGFAALPRSVTGTEQVVRVRPAGLPLGPPPDGRAYLAPERYVPGFVTRGKVGRNEPCPCGSGKKWKRCCGTGRFARHRDPAER
jgi:hypothetical protein